MARNFPQSNDVVPKSRKKTIPNKDHLSLKFPLRALNFAQGQCIDSFKAGLHTFAYGSAGTGKSYLGCYLALEKLFAGECERIVIVRSTVAVRESGFLPGSIEEKSDPYKAPYKAIINDICGCGTAWDTLTKKGLIEFITTSYIRGITLDDCVLIVDELQNFNWFEASSTLTRVGKNCQLFIIGDGKQNDLHYKKNDTSCIDNIRKVIEKMPDQFDVINFTQADIVRSEFVKQFLIACEELSL